MACGETQYKITWPAPLQAGTRLLSTAATSGALCQKLGRQSWIDWRSDRDLAASQPGKAQLETRVQRDNVDVNRAIQLTRPKTT
jgi:hypothetical protein